MFLKFSGILVLQDWDVTVVTSKDKNLHQKIIIPTWIFYSPAIACPLTRVQRTSFRPRCIHSIQQQGMWRHNPGYTSVDIVLPDYSLPVRSLVGHSSEQERSDILVLCRMTWKVNLYYHSINFVIQKYTSPFGTPSCIQETPFNQVTQNFVPEKRPHNLCNCYLYWRDISIQGKGSLFLGPFQGTPRFSKRDGPQRAQVTMMTAFTTWKVSLKSMYCNCGNSTHNIAQKRLSRFFIHYLAAWNNYDFSRFPGRII